MNCKKIYKNPEIDIVDTELSSIIAASNSMQSLTTAATPVEPKAKPSASTNITYNMVGENIYITIPSENGTRKIQEKTVIVPDGDRCIVYNSYIYTMKQFSQNATDVPYYIEKMQQALDLKNQNLSTRDIILKIASNHILNHGRIIDGDLSMIISAVSKVTEQKLNSDLEWSGMDIVFEKYGDKVFFTQYAFGREPVLVPASEYL